MPAYLSQLRDRPLRDPFVIEALEDWASRLMDPAVFRPHFWFLAFDGDTLAGCALCQSYPEAGWLSTLAVVRGWLADPTHLGHLLKAVRQNPSPWAVDVRGVYDRYVREIEAARFAQVSPETRAAGHCPAVCRPWCSRSKL